MGNCCNNDQDNLGFVSQNTSVSKLSGNLKVQNFSLFSQKTVNNSTIKKYLNSKDRKKSLQSQSQYKPNQQEGQNINNFSRQSQTIKLQKQWKTLINKIKIHILKNNQQNPSILSGKCWQFILQTFQKSYVTRLDQIEILKLLNQFIRVDYCQKHLKGHEDEDYVVDMDEDQFCILMAGKFKAIKKRIEKRRQLSQNYFKLIQNFPKYQMNFSDTFEVANMASHYCKFDINAFAFLTLYLVCCVNTKLNLDPNSLFIIIQGLQKIFNQLSILHPPSIFQAEADKEADQTAKQSLIKFQQYENSVEYPVIEYKSQDPQGRYEQISVLINQKAKQAKKDLSLFTKLIRPLCLKRGKDFKCNLKIKSKNEHLAIIRTLQKLILGKHSQSFSNMLELRKSQIMQRLHDNSYDKIQIFANAWSGIVEQVYEGILQDQTSLVFNVGDLLRAKGMFQSRKQISLTVQDIQRTIKQLSDPQYAILRTQNKLNQSTKDFKIILKINETIAELQLVKKMDLALNQFNHKIYELKRSKSLTPLFSLYTLNYQYAETFFLDLIDYFVYLLENQPKKYEPYQESFEYFQVQYLNKNVAFYGQRQIYQQIQQLDDKIIQKKNYLQTTLNKGNQIGTQNNKNRIQNQSVNDAQFMQ